MNNINTKPSARTKKVKVLDGAPSVKPHVDERIDEESLFNLFTANIMKLKKKFIR